MEFGEGEYCTSYDVSAGRHQFTLCAAFRLFEAGVKVPSGPPTEGGPIIGVTSTLLPIGGKEAGSAISKPDIMPAWMITCT